jgi:hypothetical protein
MASAVACMAHLDAVHVIAARGETSTPEADVRREHRQKPILGVGKLTPRLGLVPPEPAEHARATFDGRREGSGASRFSRTGTHDLHAGARDVMDSAEICIQTDAHLLRLACTSLCN